MLMDTHAHLNFSEFQDDLEKIVRETQLVGVEKIICVSSSISDSKKSCEIAQKYPGIIYAGVGIHPQKTDVQNTDSVEKQMKDLTSLASEKGVVCIGECGLDYSPAPPDEADRSKEEQFLLFQKQIELALKLELPVAVHCRKAFDDTLEILKSYSKNGLKGVLHCYSGGKKDIRKVLDLGFYFGLDGNLTYDSGLQNVVREIPLENIVLETDSPFLSPLGRRGERNEPKYVKIVAEQIAEIKGLKIEEIEKTTTENARQLFNL